MKSLLILLSIFMLSSCANVKQIDRGRLATKNMQLDPTPEESTFLNEVNSYREGAAGGSSAIGGGCGCN